jgi:hypothetical protein
LESARARAKLRRAGRRPAGISHLQRHPGRSPKGGEPGPSRRSRFFLMVPDNRFAISRMTISYAIAPRGQAGWLTPIPAR